MSPHDIYLETQVNTATPQRLRLMLIEAAIRRARQTAELWRSGTSDPAQQESALESLIRCRAIISELMAGISAEESPLGERVLGIYTYLFAALTEARLTRDETLLSAVIAVLEEERQTWSTVCEQLTEAPRRDSVAATKEESAPTRVSGQLMSPYGRQRGEAKAESISLDA